MVQVSKPHVRDAFVAAAAQTFAELGFAATTMADVAKRAQSSVGNLYKYFANKQQLFDAAVPAELVQELTRRTRARIRALGAAKDVRDLAPSADYHALAGDLLDYCLAHRAAVVVVLARAEGTPFADFTDNFVEKLSDWALDYARVAYPALKLTPALHFALHHAYRSFIAGVAKALQTFVGDAEARAVIFLLTSHHQGGLKRLFETGGKPDAPSLHAAKPSVGPNAARSRARKPRAADTNPSPTRSRPGEADRPRRPRRRR